MSTHVVSTDISPARWETVSRLREVCAQHLREPVAITEADIVTTGTEPNVTLVSATLSFVFEPDLTAAEQTRFNRLVSIASSAVTLSPDELTALLPSLRGLRQYQALATPTASQTVDAVKALSRVVAALLRE